jgi:hypothetical protein
VEFGVQAGDQDNDCVAHKGQKIEYQNYHEKDDFQLGLV